MSVLVLALNKGNFADWKRKNNVPDAKYISSIRDILGHDSKTTIVKLAGWWENPNYDYGFLQAMGARFDPPHTTPHPI